MSGNDLFSNTRSGSNRGAAGGRHEYDDHRGRHREENERRFAKQVASEIAVFARREGATKLVLAADPRMLGFLRESVPGTLPPGTELLEFSENLGSRSPEQIREALSRHGALPRASQ